MSPVSILMVVVLPAAFGPRNAEKFPLPDVEVQIIHGLELAEILLRL